MKRLLPLVLSAFPLLHATAQTQNLAPNPGFEEQEGSAPKGWQVLNRKTTIQSSPEAQDGAAALEIATPQSGSAWVRSAVIAVEPHVTYHLRVALLARPVKGKTVPLYGIRVYESEGGWNPPDGQPYLISREKDKDNGQEWQVKEATFETREGTKWIYIGILVDSSVTGSLLVDTLEVEKAQ